MKIIVARTAGFCMGVRRAMEIAIKAPGHYAQPVSSIGPLIHNEQVIQLLNARGVQCVDSPPESGTVILRAHGVPPAEKEALSARSLHLVDATCPHVLTSQKRIEQDSASGVATVLVGDPNHPEVKGLAGHASGALYIISSLKEAEALEPAEPFIVIAQTTFKHDLYIAICDSFRRRFPNCTVYDSICAATEERQEEARMLAKNAEALVVVGGHHSSNTKRLAEIGRECGRPTFHVETAAELDPAAFDGVNTVAVTAGASTPSWITQAVIDRLETFGKPTIPERLWHGLSFLAKSRLLTTLGAACLTHTIMTFMKASPLPILAYIITSMFVFFAYSINRRTARETTLDECIPIDPFFQRYRIIIDILTALAFLSCIACSLMLGVNILVLVLAGLVIAGLYAIPIIPKGLVYQRLKDIPASKDVLVACAWSVVLVGTISLTSAATHSRLVLLACGCLIFLLVFSQTVMLDMRDIESDQIIGIETLPVLIGRRGSMRLLYATLGIAVGLLCLFAVISSGGIDTRFSLVLILLPIYCLCTLKLMTRFQFRKDAGCQILVDSQLLFAGLLSVLWTII